MRKTKVAFFWVDVTLTLFADHVTSGTCPSWWESCWSLYHSNTSTAKEREDFLLLSWIKTEKNQPRSIQIHFWAVRSGMNLEIKILNILGKISLVCLLLYLHIFTRKRNRAVLLIYSPNNRASLCMSCKQNALFLLNAYTNALIKTKLMWTWISFLTLNTCNPIFTKNSVWVLILYGVLS